MYAQTYFQNSLPTIDITASVQSYIYIYIFVLHLLSSKFLHTLSLALNPARINYTLRGMRQYMY